MGANNSQSSNAEQDDLNSNLVTIIRNIVQSRDSQVSFDFDEDGLPNLPTVFRRVPLITPNTSRIDKNEISLSIKQACGMSKGKEKPSVASMVADRQWGQNFSPGEQCKITSNFLPNKMKTIEKYRNKAFCGTFSKDGNVFLTACQDKYLRLYQTSKGGLTENSACKSIAARDIGWSILDTAFSPNGQFIVYSSWSECIYLCPVYGDSSTQESLSLSPEERRFCIFSLDFSHDGREIIGGANDGCLYIYDCECNQRALKISSHDDDVNSVAFADETSQILYSAGDDGLCKVWDRRTLNECLPRPVGVLAGHMDGITYIDSKRDGRYLITNSKDQTIKLWDIRQFSDHKGERNTRESVSSQNWDYRWQHVPKKLYKNTSQLEGDTSVMTYRGHTVLHTHIRCKFSPAATTSQRYIYTGCGSGKVFIYDILTGKIMKMLDGHRNCVRDVHWHPYLQQIVSTSWDGVIGSWHYYDDLVDKEDTIFDRRDRSDKYDFSHDSRSEDVTTVRRSQRIRAQHEKRNNTTS